MDAETHNIPPGEGVSCVCVSNACVSSVNMCSVCGEYVCVCLCVCVCVCESAYVCVQGIARHHTILAQPAVPRPFLALHRHLVWGTHPRRIEEVIALTCCMQVGNMAYLDRMSLWGPGEQLITAGSALSAKVCSNIQYNRATSCTPCWLMHTGSNEGSLSEGNTLCVCVCVCAYSINITPDPCNDRIQMPNAKCFCLQERRSKILSSSSSRWRTGGWVCFCVCPSILKNHAGRSYHSPHLFERAWPVIAFTHRLTLQLGVHWCRFQLAITRCVFQQQATWNAFSTLISLIYTLNV
jgi:hypothetical protein